MWILALSDGPTALRDQPVDERANGIRQAFVDRLFRDVCAIRLVRIRNRQRNDGRLLVDVRTRPEWDFVGKVPGSLLIEWQSYPNSQPNPSFLDELTARAGKSDILMFLCRSGARSHAAAAAASNMGYSESYNVLQGFEGDKDAQGHRASVGGWQFAGLPWSQG